MLKKFPSDKINGTKNPLFFPSRAPTHHSVLICSFYMRVTSFVSLKLCVKFSIFDSVSVSIPCQALRESVYVTLEKTKPKNLPKNDMLELIKHPMWQGRRKLFYGGGGGGGGMLSRNVGHHGWNVLRQSPQKRNLDQNINDSKSHLWNSFFENIISDIQLFFSLINFYFCFHQIYKH